MKSMLFLLALVPLFADSLNKPITALSWLVGGTWTADASKFGNGMQRIETRYQWSDNDAYVRFTTHFVSEKGSAHTYDGNLFWNQAQSQFGMWYMDAGNQIVEGPMTVDGEAFTMTFRGQSPEGKTTDLRAEVTRKTPDHYHWAVFEKQGAQWKELFSLEYRRAAQ
ncbi:MAG TPA: hypothetical protein VGH38_01515 [Bryobacteraceae bacterium]